MSLRVTFLGTSGAVPTTQRAPSAVMVNREGDRLLFDCGEGTQRQMMRYNTGFTVSAIFVTHLHGDHILGIPGLVQSWDFNDRTDPLTIHCPRGAADEIDDLLGISPGPKYGRLHDGESVELDDGRVIDPEAVVGDPRPGRRLVYTGDTRPTAAAEAIAADAELLIHDATFADDHATRARETKHATGREAGELAAAAGVQRLALTHISSRYGADPSPIKAGAVDAFDGAVFLASDGQQIEVPYPDATICEE